MIPKKNLSLIFLLLIMHVYSQNLLIASTAATTTPATTTASVTANAAALLFPADMPTNSINEQIIDQIYGTTGLNIAANDLASIKKCYCYLEFLVKIDQVKNNPQYAQYTSDFKSFLQPNTNNGPLRPTQTLVASKGWKAIKITAQDIVSSPAWQIFSKTVVADIFYNDAQFIVDAKEGNDQLFPYLPNIEQAFFDNDFTKLRLYEESLQLQALMQHEQKNRYVTQCTDWTGMSPDKLSAAVTQFKTTDFYNLTHNAQTSQPTTNAKTGTPQPIIIPSPLREQIVCYSMLIQIQLTVHNLINQKNAQSMLTQISSTQLAPNFIFYRATDFIYMNDLFTLQNLQAQNKANPQKSLLPMSGTGSTQTTASSQTSGATNNVVIQAITPSTDIKTNARNQAISDKWAVDTNTLSVPAGATPDQAAASMFAQLPTTSIYEATLDQIYGPSGLNIAADQLANLKKSYCYLEYLVKVDKVRNDAKFSQYQLTDFKDFAHAGMTTLIMPTHALVTSKSWQAIPVTQADIVASPAWQNFIKAMVCDCIDNEKTFIVNSTDANNQMFPALQNIEAAYATNDFTSMRLYLESIQLYALMQGDQKKRYLQQSIDWKSIDPTKLDNVVATFKQSDFYVNTHNTQNSATTKTPLAFATAEQIVGYFLLITMQTDLYNAITLDNLSSFLKQGNSAPLAPNLLTYNSSDFIYLSDYLSLKNLLAQNKAHPSTATGAITTASLATFLGDAVVIQSMNNSDDDNDTREGEVVIQKIKNPFKKITKSIDKGFNDVIAKPADAALDPAKNGLTASVDKTNKESADALKVVGKDFQKGFVAIDTGIMKMSMGLATGLIDMTAGMAFAAYSIASVFPGSNVHPAAQTARLKANMDKHKAEIATVLGTVFIVILVVVTAFILAPVLIGSVESDKRANTYVQKTIMPIMMPVMMPMMLAMAQMTAEFTTGFINFSVGLTIMAYSIAHVFDPKINVQQQADRVKAKMEANRSSIDIAMSIVTTIVMTVVIMVCTAGAGAGVAAAMDAGMFGAEAAATAAETTAAALAVSSTSATASVVTTTATETAAQAALATAKIAAEQAVELAAKEGATVAMKQAAVQATDELAIATAKQAAATAAKQAAETAAKQAADLATQATAKAAARQASVAATKDLATKQAAETAAKTAFDKGEAGAAQKLAEAIAERQAAELVAKQAAEKAAQETTNFATLQAQQAAEQAAAKQATMYQMTKTAIGNIGKSITTTLSGSGTENSTVVLDETANPLAENIATTDVATGADASTTGTTASGDSTAGSTSSNAGSTQSTSASTQVATKTTSNTAERLAAKQAAQDAAKQASLKVLEDGASQTEAATARATAKQVAAQAAQKGAEKIAQQTATQLTEKQAAEKLAQTAVKQAAQNAIKDPLNPEVQAAAKQATDNLTKATAEREAAQAAAQEASTNVAQASAKVAAEESNVSAAKLAAQQAANKLAAQQSADQATADLITKANAKLLSQQAANPSTVALTSQMATQQNAQQTFDNTIAKNSADVAEKQATKDAADLALQQAQKTVLEAQVRVADSPDDPALLLAARQAADEVATKQAELDAANQALVQASAEEIAAKQLADQASAKLLETAAQITAKNSARLAERSIYQVAQEDGMWAAVKGGVTSWSFIIGQALNAGFSVFGIMGAITQDQAAAQQLAQEQQSIETLWRFVEDSKVSSTQTQNLFLDELHKKHQAAIENQAFGLQYYKNFLNGSVDVVQNQIAQALAQQYIQLLTPDSNGLLAADIGSSWGLQTPFTYLYPAQGFISTTLGRSDFPYAQEIAQEPLTAQSQTATSVDLSDNQPAATALWFNQRAVSVLNQPVTQPLNVEIKFRIIYNLTTAYHVGLYLGGNYHNYQSAAYLQSLQNNGIIDVDAAHLAKMFVLKRDDANSAPTVGLYENEGKGWIVQNPVDATMLNMASVYHMSANLNKDQLTIAFWSEDKPAAKWSQTTTVTPCDQRTFGVIFSGIAIEWGVVQPTQPITQNKTARVASNGQSEADREKASKAQWTQLLNPKFGSMTIQSPGKAALLQGQYLYTTQSTGLLDGQGNPITDYIVFATSHPDGSVTNIGTSPVPSPASSSSTSPATSAQTANAVVSLITGNVYNSANKVIAHKQNALQLYTQTNTSIPTTLANSITQAGQAYQQQLLSFTFGSYQLTALSAANINLGIFIYTCPTTITTLDATGKPILDYLIMADIVNNTLGSTVGMPPSSTVQGMISLVTGNVYNKTSATPIDSGYSEMTQYLKQYSQLPAADAATISAAATTYTNATASQAQAAQATQQAQVNVVASQTISLSDLLNPGPPITGGAQVGLSSAAPSNIVATTSSISQLQTAAAGSASMQISGFGPVGLSFGASTTTDTNSAPATYAIAAPTTGTTAVIAQPQTTPANPAATSVAATTTTSATPSTTVPATPTAAPAAALNNSDFGLVGSSGFSF